MNRKYVIVSPDVQWLVKAVIDQIPHEPIHEVIIREHKSKRTLDQNAKMWAMLTDISEQVEWYGQHLTKEEWKTVFTAGLKRQQVVPGIDGGFVVLGTSTSKMTVKEMADLIELAYAFGTQHEVRWSEPENIRREF